MILSDKDIRKALELKSIHIDPQPDLESHLGSCSLDLTLGDVFTAIDGSITDHLQNGSITIKPQEFLLGVTKEYIELPDDLCGMLHGRSSLGRKGLMIHSTAPLIDAGFKGKVVLELYNCGPHPITLKVGERVCAVSFEQLTSTSSIPYHKKRGAKFVGQSKP
jgi:dCTP deaminase